MVELITIKGYFIISLQCDTQRLIFLEFINFKALIFLCVVGVAMSDCVIHDIINGGDPRRAWGG